MSIPTRKIGNAQSSALGHGLMSLAAFYGQPKSQAECDAVFKHLISKGVTHWDTSDIYTSRPSLGQGEEQLGSFFKNNPGAREKVFLATKFVFALENGQRSFKGGSQYPLEACANSLKRLETDKIDLYYAHRPVEPVEEQVQGMKKLQEQGKIRFIGVSEFNLDQLERANKVAHIDALQIELSPWTPEVLKNGILDWCRKNGTALVAYSPLGRGFLSGTIKSPDDFEQSDFRRGNERFQGENFTKNLKLVEDIKKIADRKGATPSQISLAWVMAQDPCIIPIPGSTQIKNIDENIGSLKINLSKDEIDEITNIVNSFKVSGERYPEAMRSIIAF